MKPTLFQQRVLTVPEQWNVLLAGGRGGGKTGAIKLLVLKHCQKYGSKARPLLIRETYKAASELEDELEILFKQAYGKKVNHNRADHTFRLPNGAVIEIGQLERSTDYAKYQGRSFTFLVIDEAGLLKENKWVALLKSNLRATPGIPLQEVRAANPGGLQHAYLHQRFIAAAPPGHPFELDGETWVWLPSTLRDNPHLVHDDYEKKLRAAAGSDEALARAWIEGDWNINRGSMFADVLDPEKQRLVEFRWDIRKFKPSIGMDWGTARPSVVYLGLRAIGGTPFPRGSIILLDEVATNEPNDLNVGLEWPPSKLAEATEDMCKRHGLRRIPHGVGDDAYGLQDSLLDVLKRHGMWLETPSKGRGSRVSGWAKMRELLYNVKHRNGKPGLWVMARCKYWWATVPFLPRDPDRPEDIISSGPDHGADASRYLISKQVNSLVQRMRTT